MTTSLYLLFLFLEQININVFAEFEIQVKTAIKEESSESEESDCEKLKHKAGFHHGVWIMKEKKYLNQFFKWQSKNVYY
jgi:hypothetical protein